MIYLIGEIIIYLMAALLLGAVAGWLLQGARRHAGRRVEEIDPAPATVAPQDTAGVQDARVGALEAALRARLQRIRQLESALAERGPESDPLARRLAAAEQRVLELERERELQNRALRVLHQQLELAGERGSRQPARATGTAG